MRNRHARGAVVLGGGANGLGVVRALGARGIPVDVVVSHKGNIAHYSRYARNHWIVDFVHDPDALLELLERRAEDWAGWGIVPSNDDSLSVLAKHHQRLSQWYAMTTPPWEIARRVLDKETTYKYAREVGIDLPRSYGFADSARAFTQQVNFPALVKPSVGYSFRARFRKKLFIVRGPDELTVALDKVNGAGLRCEVFDLIPGPDNLHYNYQAYIDKHGKARGEFMLRKLRLAPPLLGVGRACETAWVPELREPSLELLRRIGWRGCASIQYKLDPRDGRFKLIEVNGRCVLVHGLARRAGINYPLMAWSENTEGSLEGDEPNGWEGVWIHLIRDLGHTVTSRLLGREEFTWREFFRSYRRPKTFADWSADDPKPFWRLALLTYTPYRA